MQLQDVVEQVAQGAIEAGWARSLSNTMALRQNNWTLGAFCESYCRIVTGHHSLEDRSIFPRLRRGDRRLAPAVDLLDDTLRSHLTYEERELVEPLGRLGYY